MSETAITILSAMLGGGLIGGIASVVVKLLEQRKTNADAEKSSAEATETLSDTALELVKGLRQELADVRADRERDQCAMRELEATVKGLTVRVQTLERALEEADSDLRALECQHDAHERQHTEVVNGANDLSDQISGMGAKPVYIPPPRVKRS